MKIIHLSDLHFGTESHETVEALSESITVQAPDLVIISGDFTQIGSDKEFKVAQAFLKTLSAPYFSVPGNHDVPAVNLLERFFTPYKDYKTYIDDDLCPQFENNIAVIAGVNSSRRALPHWNWANGAVSEKQRQHVRGILENAKQRWKIAVLHHPVHKVQDMPIDVTVFGRKRTLECFHDLKVDLVLTGHVHHASITTRGDEEHQSVYVSASTALSSRKRGQENGFNTITLNQDSFKIDVYTLQSAGFENIKSYTHKALR